MAPCRATPFSLAPETLRTLLPKRPELTPEDEAEIQIPDRRYEQIKDAIAELFRKVDDLYTNPEKTFSRYAQYRLCCTPDFSVYGEMPTWRQMESVAHGRWVGAWWQSKGMSVVPTVSWDKYASFDFCFDGIEQGCVVAVATYACRQDRLGYLRGYSAMLERIRPPAVICYGHPFPGMGGPIVEIPPRHPRAFHREL